jgi:hypothetical protein
MMTKTQRETAVARKRAAAERRRQEKTPKTVVDWDACWDRVEKMLNEHTDLQNRGEDG